MNIGYVRISYEYKYNQLSTKHTKTYQEGRQADHHRQGLIEIRQEVNKIIRIERLKRWVKDTYRDRHDQVLMEGRRVLLGHRRYASYHHHHHRGLNEMKRCGIMQLEIGYRIEDTIPHTSTIWGAYHHLPHQDLLKGGHVHFPYFLLLHLPCYHLLRHLYAMPHTHRPSWLSLMLPVDY